MTKPNLPESNPSAGAGGCPVPFCRGNCPTLPDSAEVRRASQHLICDKCQLPIHAHPKYAYPTGMRHVYLTCDGIFNHT